MHLKIAPLNRDILPAFLHFFDSVAFSDNPDWAWCYCQYFHAECSKDEWKRRTKEANRNHAIDLIRHNAMSGFLAFSGDDPVGWVNAGRKQDFPRISTKPAFNDPRDSETLAIVCFLIAPAYRRQGICAPNVAIHH